MSDRGWRQQAAVIVAALLTLTEAATGVGQAAAAGRTRIALLQPAAGEQAGQAAAGVVARAEAALAELAGGRLVEPFGGKPPAWAREWVERRGRDDLFGRRWRAHAVRLPRPYWGAEWLAVFSQYHPVEADADHFHRLERRNGAWVIGAEIDEREPAREYRISHHELQVRLLPAEHRMEATDRMSVRRLAGARGLMLARMNDDYQVAEVRVAGALTPFVRAGGLLAVSVPTGEPRDLTVELRYSGEVRHPGMDSIDPEVTYLFSYWYPNVARLPATYDLTVTAPVAWTTIAQGELHGREEAGPEARTRWRLAHPVCWLQLASGPYQRISRAVADKTLNVYLLEPNPRKAEAAFESLEKALPFFSKTFSPFPWTHYDVVEYPLAAGALEGYSMTASSLEMIPGALPHELAHSWWGGVVPNTYIADMWTESFATYSERLLREATSPGPPRGSRTGEPRPRERRRAWSVPILGAGDALQPEQSSVGYGKGAAVLHMFRRTVGDDRFHQSIARFLKEMNGRAATWRDFQRAAEAVTGQRLAWFFDPWLTRTDLPRVRWLAARQDGDVLTAEIELLSPAYRLRLPIAIDTADGRRRIEWVDLDQPRKQVRWTLPARALRLVLDPAADFLLEPGAGAGDPWTLEVGQQAGDAGRLKPRQRGHEVGLRRLWAQVSEREQGTGFTQ